MFRGDDSIALIDFGLAKRMRMEMETDITNAGEIFGTPYYMSPEQGHGNDVDIRSDLYSLGIIFYEMLTGDAQFLDIAAPPVRYPNVYGIDMPAASELIANGRTDEEVRELIGADKLVYQDLHGLIRSVRHDNSGIREFDTSCFSGEYVTGDVTDEYLNELEQRRNDAAKKKREGKRKGLVAVGT